MKIGVISDTHLKRPSRFLEEVAERFFNDADLILHCGDLVSLEVLGVFKGKDLVAVAGNADPARVREKLPQKEIIHTGHFRIGMLHGWGPPLGLEKRISSSFEKIDCIVYGHSHWPSNHRVGGILFFNPGAFSRSITSFWRRSIGILTVTDDIESEVIRV